MRELEHWDSFYVIVGSAAGALVGIMFVVITLVASRPIRHAFEASFAFASPTIVHFSTAFLASALARAPWHDITSVAACWAALGCAGIGYSAVVARRMRTQRAYPPDREDWVFYFAAPVIAYALLAVSAFAAPASEHEALFGIAASILLLIFTGIRNAWDATVYSGLAHESTEDSPS
jgi:surface polysaccharide O-acyltransferase-like enzyme